MGGEAKRDNQIIPKVSQPASEPTARHGTDSGGKQLVRH